ncbi:unnamed protein product [Amoebophrya sp. A120]|nr:unnamed protein product [Amoebophrya sp. A120]|eukprot:GSA120T00016258001.1
MRFNVAPAAPKNKSPCSTNLNSAGDDVRRATFSTTARERTRSVRLPLFQHRPPIFNISHQA